MHILSFDFSDIYNMLNILKKRIFFAFIFSHLLPAFLPFRLLPVLLRVLPEP